MKKVSGILAILFVASTLLAQAPAKAPEAPKTKEIAVKSSTAEDGSASVVSGLHRQQEEKASDTLQQSPIGS